MWHNYFVYFYLFQLRRESRYFTLLVLNIKNRVSFLAKEICPKKIARFLWRDFVLVLGRKKYSLFHKSCLRSSSSTPYSPICPETIYSRNPSSFREQRTLQHLGDKHRNQNMYTLSSNKSDHIYQVCM